MTGNAEDFLYVHMVGARFQDGFLPISAVEEFKNYRELLISLSKHLYRNVNPNSKKVHLKKLDIITNDLIITSLYKGSTGVNISLLRTNEGNLIDYTEEARRLINEAFISLNQTGNPPQDFPTELLPKLAAMGKNLRDGESYIWSKDHYEWQNSKAKLTNKTTYPIRKINRVFKPIEDLINVFIVGVCADPLGFNYKTTLNSTTKQGKFKDPNLFNTLKECAEVANRAPLVALSVLTDPTNNKVVDVLGIEHVLPVDWSHRLDELAALEHGWLDGGGNRISREAIKATETILFFIADEAMERPGIFPTMEGGIHLEWSDENDTEIVIDPSGSITIFSDNISDEGLTSDPRSLLPILLESLNV